MEVGMALNCSHRPIFPAHIAEDNYVSPIRIVNGYLMEGVPDRKAEDFERSWHVNREHEEFINYGREIVDGCSTSDSGSEWDEDFLPSDPFGMDTSVEAPACSDGNQGAPHEALSFVLAYIGLKDLLSVEMTCRSLFNTVRNDPFLWKRIHIDTPLNERITDDSLLQLTCRAQGYLDCLSLLECSKITDVGLKRVVDFNPRLNKLCVPACTRLSIEGIVGIVKAFNHTKGTPGIRFLRVGGIYGITPVHFETLKLLLDANDRPELKQHRPHFYVRGNIYLLCDDERAIDVELCPRCQKLRLVYDCPAESCRLKNQTIDSCRACALCIPRCSECGRCIRGDDEYEENFVMELVCSVCSLQKEGNLVDRLEGLLGSN